MNALSINRKGREIELAEKLTRKNEKQINHQNQPKSQNKLKKNNSLQWPLGVFTSGKLKQCIGNYACIFRQRYNCVELRSYERQVDMSFTLSRM